MRTLSEHIYLPFMLILAILYTSLVLMFIYRSYKCSVTKVTEVCVSLRVVRNCFSFHFVKFLPCRKMFRTKDEELEYTQTYISCSVRMLKKLSPFVRKSTKYDFNFVCKVGSC